ncbi:MAG: helix-turn-helix transcriptional regulator [Fimbriimonadaceae bacterium]|nr:helix-turn-helix transcriptional regulator [Fimbriimonadaceae bacterium]
MVEQTLDNVFGALSNQYRRDILRRVTKAPETASSLAKVYGMTIAAVAKHFRVLERAGLIQTRKEGKERLATLAPAGFRDAQAYLDYYERYWNRQLDQLESFLKENP